MLGGLAEWLATLALIALVWDRTHSAFVSGAVLALRIAPAAVISGLLGRLIDRFERRRVLVACTAGRACIYGALPLVGGVAPVLALALLAEVGTIAFMSARDATVPRLVPARHLASANAVSMASAFAAMPVGSGLFALLSFVQAALGRPGNDLSLLFASFLFATSTMMLRRLASEPHPEAAIPEPLVPVEPGERIRFRDVLRADPVLRRVVLGGVVVACCGGTLLTLGMAYVRSTLHAGPAAYSGLMTTFCAGAITGVVALQKQRTRLPKVFHAGAGAMGAILLAMAVFPSTAVGFAMSFVFGGAFVSVFLGGITILQERVDDAVRGRAFALAHSGLRVGAVAVGLLAAWGARAMGAGRVLWTMDGTQVVLAAAGLVMFAVTTVLMSQGRRIARAAAAAAA
jgi:dTMP kinase